MEVLTVVSIDIAAIFLLGGILMYNTAKKPINYMIGYRTKRAMASREAWEYANKACGKAWAVMGAAGLVLMLASLLIAAPRVGEQTAALIMGALLAAVIIAAIAAVVKTEKKLKSIDKGEVL
ncbi:MAG: SdpI family protein [Ruminococcus sp.]|nr:SdpI family protein [Ruminococcus sp.]